MAEIDRSQLGPDELFLSGRIQVDTAIAVLAMTGVNPQARNYIRAVREVHDTQAGSEAQNDFTG